MKSKKTPVITSKRIQYLFTGIAKLITSSLEVQKTLDAIMEQVHLFFQPRNWSLLRVDPATNELYFIIAKGMDPDLMKNIRLKVGEGIAGHVALTGKSMYVAEAESDPYFSKKIDEISGFKTRSIIAVPIVFQGRVLGVIELINTLEDRKFTRRELSILEVIADFSAIALVNAMAYEQMLQLAIKDPLTGLYNRSRLDELLKVSESAPPEEDMRQSLNDYVVAVWVDVDKFKDVNDHYGHQIGDEILLKTAKHLQACCREGLDYAFRVGGDEFLLLVMNLYKNDINVVIQRLNEKLNIYSHDISPAKGFSFGIASGTLKNLEQVIVEADDLMYKHKKLKEKQKEHTH